MERAAVPETGCSAESDGRTETGEISTKAMTAMLRDEVILNTDTFVPFDPAKTIRPRAQALIATHRWSTDQIWYGDQREPTVDIYGDDSPLEDGSQPEGDPRWSFSFNLGLDHIGSSTADWFADVCAILDFLGRVHVETGAESLVDVRYRSTPWFSETVAYCDGSSRDDAAMREIIEQLSRLRPVDG